MKFQVSHRHVSKKNADNDLAEYVGILADIMKKKHTLRHLAASPNVRWMEQQNTLVSWQQKHSSLTLQSSGIMWSNAHGAKALLTTRSGRQHTN